MINLRISAKSISRILTIELFFVFFCSALIDFLHFPSFITYTIDFANLFVLLFFMKSVYGKEIIISCKYENLYFFTIVLVLICFFTALINYVNPLLAMWGARNSLRYFLFFLLLIIFWTNNDTKKFVDFLIWFQFPNFFIVLYQFHIMGYAQDYLGGIFGHTKGCNSYVNVYMCVVVALVIVKYMYKNTSILLLVYTIISWMYIAALTELKIAFIEIPVIVLLAIFMKKPSFRTIFIVGTIGAGVWIGLQFVVQYFPEWEIAFQDIQNLLEVGESTEGGYNISRIGAFNEINAVFFKDSLFHNIFGYGLGNCEYSAFEFLISPFYKIYGHYNYRWFSHQMWFLQCGYLGVICIGTYMFILGMKIFRNKYMYGDKDGYAMFGYIIILVIIVNFVYNASMTTEVGYILFGALAIPFVYFKDKIMNNNEV